MRRMMILTVLFLVGLSFCANAQNNYIAQPDSAKIYFDTTEYSHYGGVYNYQCSYDPDGLLTYQKVEDAETGQCSHGSNQYIYDLNHNETCDEYLAYNCFGESIQNKTERLYHNNLIKSKTKYTIPFHSVFWVFSDSASYEYDEAKRLILYEFFNVNRTHTLSVYYEYEDHKKVITTEQLKEHLWRITKRETQCFSENDLLLSKMIEVDSNGSLVNNTLITYSYDNQGHCMSVLTQEWKNESWTNVKMVVNNYDDNGHLVVATLKTWQDKVFAKANRVIYELNETGYPAVVSFEKWNDDKWVEGCWVSDFYVYSESHLKRQNDALCNADVRRIEIHYATTPMPDYDIDEHPSEQRFCTLYPNPTTGLVTIKGENLHQAEVLNTLGQRVATAQGKGETLQIDIAHLPVGIYFVSITDEEGRKCVRKVMKE